MDTTYTSQSSDFDHSHHSWKTYANSICNFFYGSQKRTNITLVVTFAMLVGGIALMQGTANMVCGVGG